MVKRLVGLTEILNDWLTHEAAKTGISVSELVRRVLDVERARRTKRSRTK